MIRYTVLPVSPERHLFRVTAALDNVAEALIWRIPKWVPGSYTIRDFARHVVTARADADGQPLTIAKQNSHQWQTAAPTESATVTVTIDVHAHDPSVRAAFLDNRHGFFDGTSVFLQPVGHDDRCELTLQAPVDRRHDHWEVATGLTPHDTDTRGFGTFVAENYDGLVDHPVMMGRLQFVSFEVQGALHRIVLNGRYRADVERLVRDVQRICATHASLFGDKPPMEQYTFLLNVTDNSYGGIEHRNSSSLACPRATLPTRKLAADEVSDDYRVLLGLFSHEYFHLWNVKRIKPAAFTPYDLSREVHTELLWAFEGITSYYDNLALARSGVITPESYLELLAQDMTRVARGHGRLKQTVAESSFDAWTRFYKQDANAPNAIVSYYVKGALVALALDLTIRRETGGKKSLDDVMRLLWERHGSDTSPGVPEGGVRPLAEEVAGVDLAAFFDQALHSTNDLDLAALLEPLGVNVHWRGAADHADKGGKPGEAAIHLGALIAADTLGVKLRVLHEQGGAMQAGLAPGDVLVAVDDLKVTHAGLDETLAAYIPGDKARLHAFRGDELMTFDMTLATSEPDFAWLAIAADGLTVEGRNWLRPARS